MVTCRSQTSIQRGLGKVRKARAVVMALLAIVAGSIVFIDKKEEREPQQPSIRVSEVAAPEKVTPTTITDNGYELAIPSRDNIIQKNLDSAKVNSPKNSSVEEERGSAQVVSPIISQAKQEEPVTKREGNRIPANVISPLVQLKTPERYVGIATEEKHQSLSKRLPAGGKTLKRSRGIEQSAQVESDDATDGGNSFHCVAPGETLSSIAKRYYGQATLSSVIQRANPDLNPNALKPGRRIRIPAVGEVQNLASRRPSSRSGSHTAETVTVVAENSFNTPHHATAPGKYYVVGKGETLSSIAKRSGVRFLSLYEQNREVLHHNPNFLKEGMQIWIPKK